MYGPDPVSFNVGAFITKSLKQTRNVWKIRTLYISVHIIIHPFSLSKSCHLIYLCQGSGTCSILMFCMASDSGKASNLPSLQSGKPTKFKAHCPQCRVIIHYSSVTYLCCDQTQAPKILNLSQSWKACYSIKFIHNISCTVAHIKIITFKTK